jgi:hypothetical protein
MSNRRICASAGEQLGEAVDDHWDKELILREYKYRLV